MSSRRVVVVGAGLGGLTVAWHLQRAGLDVVVFESAAHAGGAMRTGAEGGFRYEHGPNTVLDKEPATHALLDQLGLRAHMVRSGPEARVRYLWTRGRLRAIPLGPGLLTSDLLSVKARARLLAEVAVPPPRAEDESIYEFGVRHLGEEATRLLIDPMVTGIFAGDIERLSLESCFPNMRRLEKEHRSIVLGAIAAWRRAQRENRPPPMGHALFSFRDGLGELPNALATALGERVRLGTPVAGIATSGGDAVVTLQSGEQLEAERVVVATPAPAAADLFASFAPRASELLRDFPYAAVAVVHLGYPRASISGDVAAFGFLAPEAERLPILGCIFTSTLFPDRAPPGHALFTVMVGGARHPERTRLVEPELIALAAREVERVLGISSRPVFAKALVWPRAIPQYEVGTLRRERAIREALAELPVELAGNCWGGVGVNDVIRTAGEVARSIIGKASAAP